MVLFLLCHIATRRWRNTMIQPLVKRSREKGGHQRFCVKEWCEKRILVSEIRRCYLIRYVILIFGASLAAARDKYAGWPLPISPPPIGDIPLVPFFTPNATFERPPRVKRSGKKKKIFLIELTSYVFQMKGGYRDWNISFLPNTWREQRRRALAWYENRRVNKNISFRDWKF